MSTGLELIPLAIAIGVSVASKRKPRTEIAEEGPEPAYAMETRMRDRHLLVHALGALGASAIVEDGTVSTELDRVPVTFALPPDVEVFDAHFAGGVDEQVARAIISRIDAAYIDAVCGAVREKVLERASQHGLVVSGEQEESDGSLLLTLEVSDG